MSRWPNIISTHSSLGSCSQDVLSLETGTGEPVAKNGCVVLVVYTNVCMSLG